MDRERILTRLQQLTGNLKPSERSTARDLNDLQRTLVKHLAKDPDFAVSGERFHHEGVDHLEATRDVSFEHFSNLDPIIHASIAADDSLVSPLVFRRTTEFQSSLVGNSVPVWGSGMAVSQSFGPFLDDNGLHIWFDFYQPTRMVSVCFKGNSTPVLLIPVWGTISPKKTYKIEAGSVWIASSLIVNNSSLAGYYTGLKVRGGSLELTDKAEVDAERIIIKPGVTGTLSLDLDQNVAGESSPDAGFDAAVAEVNLPQACSLKFTTATGQLTAGDASCTVFGTEAKFRFLNTAPIWFEPISQILIPYAVKSTGDSPEIFSIRTSDSLLCTLSKQAKIGAASGWLLPAAKVAPQQLGKAAGTGALVIGLSRGISTTWKGLSESATRLIKPAIITEPGLVTVADFFAENTLGRQRWVLWENEANEHHSDITLGFGKAFPFIYLSSVAGSEAVIFFCKHKASLERPVDANGSPFVIESSIALASIAQTASRFRASLFDNDLLFDGNPNQPHALEIRSIVLRNAFFNVSRPYSLFLTGELTDDNQVTAGTVVLLFGIYRYLPTLPDPYVASYATSKRLGGTTGFLTFGMGLAGFVKWPNPAEAGTAEDGSLRNPAYVYFRFAPFDRSLLLGQASAISAIGSDTAARGVRNFQIGVRAFNRNLISDVAIESAVLPVINAEKSFSAKVSPLRTEAELSGHPAVDPQATDTQAANRYLQANPATKYLRDQVELGRFIAKDLPNAERIQFGDANREAFAAVDTRAMMAARSRRDPGALMFTQDAFILLDVSSNADQMGVSWGTSIEVGRDQRGNATLSSRSLTMSSLVPGTADLPLQILNMDVVGIGHNLRAITLPQISWEPISNFPLEVESPTADDTITIMPGLMVYENDGIPTRIGSLSPYPVPIAPIPVTKHFVKEFNDDVNPRQLQSMFTLPFAMIASAEFDRKPHGDPKDGARISIHRPYFEELRGGMQIKSLAPAGPSSNQSGAFKGWTIQLDENTTGTVFGVPITGQLKTSFFAIPINGSTLGKTVKTIFNKEFSFGGNKPKVPVEKMEFSGYGASMFSNWLDGGAAIAEVSQALFEVLLGRTAHEVVQVRSILYPWGVHVVRTVTLMRSANGYVFRSDSGWKAESDGFFDFRYKINFDTFPDKDVLTNPYEVHHDVVKGVSNVREIKDNAAASPFTSSFRLNDPNLPTELQGLSVPEWQDLYQDPTLVDTTYKLDVEMQAVVFDADVHMNDVTSGGVKDPVSGDFIVQSRKMLGYVQLKPAAILVPTQVFAALLDFQNGSLGGPVDCIINIARSDQKMRLNRVDVSAAKAGSKDIFVSVPHGSLLLPPDGSWSVVKQQTDTKDVKVLEEGQSVPLIKRNGVNTFRIAEPKDIAQPTTNSTYGIVQSTGTQKLLFDMPQFTPNVKKLQSAQTYFADAYKLLNSKGVFPNVANALGLTNAEREVEILGEGLMKMAERDINVSSLLPANFSYPFVNEPGILKIYAEYSSTGGAAGNLKLGINSLGAAADKWKAALSNIKVVVDLGPFDRLMWVDGNFNASSGIKTKYDKPNLQFGPMLNTVKDILQVLAALSGDDFDDGMSVGMSNSADSWEYKFNCSQEIPVIKFPSPALLSANPNPPLKLEAGLRVGFYFNEVIAVPTDLKQLVPACGAYVDFYGRIQVMCFTLAAASVYAVGQVNLGIAADSKAGISLRMKFGFGVEIVVGLPVVGNVSVLYMIEIEVGIDSASVTVGAFMLFRGHAEICSGLVGVTIQIEAGGSVKRTGSETNCIAQVTFSIDIQILWVIDISFSETWQEARQIS